MTPNIIIYMMLTWNASYPTNNWFQNYISRCVAHLHADYCQQANFKTAENDGRSNDWGQKLV